MDMMRAFELAGRGRPAYVRCRTPDSDWYIGRLAEIEPCETRPVFRVVLHDAAFECNSVLMVGARGPVDPAPMAIWADKVIGITEDDYQIFIGSLELDADQAKTFKQRLTDIFGRKR